MSNDDKYLINKAQQRTEGNAISIGTTWVDGRIIFKHATKYGKFWYGICHFSEGVFAVSPLDYEKPTLIGTIIVAPLDQYCERAYSCLNTNCPLNRFNMAVFVSEFKDMGEFSLGMPKNFAEKGLWCNQDEFKDKWKGFIIPVEGGVLRYDKIKGDKLGVGD